MISLIIPSYNEEAVLQNFYLELTSILIQHNLNYELIFVNDGSRDKTLEEVKNLAKNSTSVRYISFSRNFGKEAAMLAGLQYANGEAVIIMDADLQHPPELIPKMVKAYQAGFDQVIAKRNRRGETVIRSAISKLYYRLMNRIVDVMLKDGVGDFRLLSKRAVNALLSLQEYNRFSKGLFSWIGFQEHVIEYENVTREAGSSKWTFSKLLNYGIDGMISFNNKPLRASIYMGLLVTFVDIFYIFYTFIQILMYGVAVPGYFTIIASVGFIGGIQLIFLGVVGEYIGRIYYEVKRRPHFIIDEENVRSLSRIKNEKQREKVLLS